MVLIISLYKLPRGRGSCWPPTQQQQTLLAQLTMSVVRTAHAPQYTLQPNFCELLFGKEFIVNSQSKRHTHWTTSCSFAIVADTLCSVARFPISVFSVIVFGKKPSPHLRQWQNAEVQYQYLQYWQQISHTMVPPVRALSMFVQRQEGISLRRGWTAAEVKAARSRVCPQHVKKIHRNSFVNGPHFTKFTTI